MYSWILYALEFEVVRFVGAGVAAAFIYYSIYSPLSYWRPSQYLWWTGIAFIPAFVVSFLLQKYWTFNSGGSGIATVQLLLYGGKKIGFQVGNGFLLRWIVQKLSYHPLLAQPVAHVLLALASYAIAKLIFSL